MVASKTIVVTGVSSFVGCHLARTFAQAGHNVIAVTSRAQDRYEGIRKDRLAFIQNNVDFAVCDLMDKETLGRLISLHKPDVWVQHAGYADNYGAQNFDLEKSLGLNVLALEPLYRQLSGTGCSVIVTGSSMEYASCDAANEEGDACWPDMPYGVSKLATSVEASRLAGQYNVPTRVARLYIPVGSFDAPGKLMDFVIKQLAAGKSADLSPCEQKRDFLGVDDLCEAYVLMVDDMDRTLFDVFNICSGEAVQLKALMLRVADLMDVDVSLLNFGARNMRPGEAPVSFGSNQKAKDILNWAPKPIEQALRMLISHAS
ncbi:MAG: NAD(P)-dependent oxidoreductase [Magnetovibrio sp.]|nr:NAD(P)-dependent oxidoreductase [Magnetovibrio sp.]